jgi:hypothetical protein
MSYEGYEEALCKNGHRYFFGAFEENARCPYCGADCAWSNSVDTTNCNKDGKLSEKGWNYLLISLEEIQTCNLGHKHVTKEAVYRIPKHREMDSFRTYYDD